MKIYTSYWAQVRNFPKNLIGFNTTMWPPKWRPLGQDKRGVICIDCPPLKPGSSCDGLCDGKCADKHPESCAFLKAYRAQLDALDFNEIVQKIEAIARIVQKGEGFKDVDVALLFYEAPKNKCSERILIQQWFRDNGMEIEEWHK